MAGYSTTSLQKFAKIATVYRTAVAITPTDATAIGPFECLYVGGAGDVALVPLGQSTPVVFKAVPAGTFIPVECQGVNLTSTTATNIVGLG